ncbi:MAG: DUF4440 domain-containing protein [Acidimicrobiales bacterium]
MRIPRLLGAFLALTLLVGACSDDDSDDTADGTSTEVPAEVNQLLDDYAAAIEAADGDAVMGYLTDDFTWTSDLVSDQDREAYAASVANYVDFSVETIADRTAVGNENWYVVSSPEEVSAAGASDEGISVYRVVRSGDAWMIDLHRFTGLPG